MTDREAFLRAIRAHPDDDTPRLIFADWLEEYGDPAQAEFIRLQVELEPVRDQLDQPRVRELAERESILLATHGHDWLGPAADLVGPYPAFGPVFRRGLPEMVCLSLGTFLDRAEELFATCPTVREVCVYGVQGHGAELAACRQLGLVETLEIADPVYSLFPEESTALCEALRAARVYRVRFPGWCNPPFTHPHLFNSLGLVIASGWPRWVEFVYLVMVGGVAEQEVGAFTIGGRSPFDTIAGRPVSHYIRPFDAAFPLDYEIGHGLYPGVNEEGDAILLAVRSDWTGVWIHFDDRGRVQDASTFGSISPEEVERWQAERGYPIRVHEFQYPTIGLALRLWPHSYIRDYLQNPFERPPGVSDHWWESRGGVLKRWLHEGRFVIEWDGREYTADATGKIIAG